VIPDKILKKVGNLVVGVKIEVRDMIREATEVTEGIEVILEKGIQDDISSPKLKYFLLCVVFVGEKPMLERL